MANSLLFLSAPIWAPPAALPENLISHRGPRCIRCAGSTLVGCAVVGCCTFYFGYTLAILRKTFYIFKLSDLFFYNLIVYQFRFV